MDGIILINKKKQMTSRDVVNLICKKLNTRKVGHTGTLDPIATGLMIICVKEGLKLVELLTGHDKEYIAKVRLGIRTNTYDITGDVIEIGNINLEKEKLINALNSFVGEYMQEVPLYSSVKVNGKRLYEYARNNIKVDLPKHLVKINKIQLLEFNNDSFTFKVNVSSGTYIRSLINDIGNKLGVLMTMEELVRTKVGDYSLSSASDINSLKIIPIIDSLNIKKVEVKDDTFLKKIANGVPVDNIYDTKLLMFIKNNKPISIYQDENGIMKSYRVFNL